jgi:serine/threonine protein kinase
LQLEWPRHFNICVGIARGLTYLHEDSHQQIIHRDIKPPNILLDKQFNAKIADFGLVRLFPDDESHMTTFHIARTR